MASLDDHLSELGHHGRLGYRADCAVCRLERENRHLPESKLRSMRAQATAFALLLGVSGAAAGPAAAGTPAGGPQTDAAVDPEPGAEPGSPVGQPPAAPASADRPPALGTQAVADSGGRHVVRPGDTVRSIAAGQLGARASEAEVAAHAERVWRLNARRIASGDPAELAPGEVLALPRH